MGSAFNGRKRQSFGRKGPMWSQVIRRRIAYVITFKRPSNAQQRTKFIHLNLGLQILIRKSIHDTKLNEKNF